MSEENIKIEGGEGVVQNLDLDKYTDLLLKLDEANDKIREMEALTQDLRKVSHEVQPKEKFTFSGLFMDDNKINETGSILIPLSDKSKSVRVIPISQSSSFPHNG